MINWENKETGEIVNPEPGTAPGENDSSYNKHYKIYRNNFKRARLVHKNETLELFFSWVISVGNDERHRWSRITTSTFFFLWGSFLPNRFNLKPCIDK